MKDETNYRANDQMEIGKKRRGNRLTKQNKKERNKTKQNKTVGTSKDLKRCRYVEQAGFFSKVFSMLRIISSGYFLDCTATIFPFFFSRPCVLFKPV